ncbi:MAG: helix-turn-helix transcriptional regulator [Candidatus Saccharibacteria bacterium]|nr:helix-turn-helix transcriptional regulator [Candidatus Saccharibacteria bacterium]
MLFNDKLKKIRGEYNLTQEELAEKLDVSRQAITKWESGEGMPDVENLKQLAILFNTTLDELIMEDKKVLIPEKRYKYIEEMEIDHSKHFDVKLNKIGAISIFKNSEEKVKLEILSDTAKPEESLKIKFDNRYDRMDIEVKNKQPAMDVALNLYLPEKYIDEIELASDSRTINITDLDIKKIEYDGDLKYLNVKGEVKGKIILNTTKCDIEANYDKFDGALEVNTINSTARVTIPMGTTYQTVLKGIKNHFVDAINTANSNNVIELNGIGSKLIVIEK